MSPTPLHGMVFYIYILIFAVYRAETWIYGMDGSMPTPGLDYNGYLKYDTIDWKVNLK